MSTTSPQDLREAPLPGIKEAELFRVRLPFQNPFRTSFGEVDHQESLLVRVRSENGLEGWGEAPTGPYPRYSHESSKTAWHILSDFLLPALIELNPDTIGTWETDHPFIRGHPMARGSVIMALMDLGARFEEVSLNAFYGVNRSRARAGISLGIQENMESLFSRIKQAVEEGYLRVKLKIKPGTDRELLEPVREQFPDLPLMVDGNGGYRPRHTSRLKELDQFSLMMIEQPFAPPDLLEHSRLQKQVETPICLDESITHPELLKLVNELNACKVINIKAPRLGGPLEAIEVHDDCVENNLEMFCGGLLETGIGRAHNVALASLPGFRLPGDISASSRYFPEDVVEPEFQLSKDGTLSLPEKKHGIGVQPKNSFIRENSCRVERFS